MKLDSGQVACRRSCRQGGGWWTHKAGSHVIVSRHLKEACRRLCRLAGATSFMILHSMLTRCQPPAGDTVSGSCFLS